ncbi:MAG TPA: Glu/Leu/Phe/Val dehydrogenase [Firmicutes bacterium]|nr:Glu/Leu/Phe/Val dehydrogenase [Bacillota bacterium]
MNVFERMASFEHEQVSFCYDEVSGLKAIIAIHSTALGPALGGCRMWTYEDDEAALKDALRLSRGMTYKNAAAGLNLGGGKAVIIGDPRREKSEQLFRAFGRFVDSFGGRYITAEDVGTACEDMEYVKMETDYVAGLRQTSGDPSPVTAFGVYRGIKACAKWKFGNERLRGRTIVVQGLGHVGMNLVRHLVDEGARVVGSDVFQDRVQAAVEELKIESVEPQKVYDVECDIFAPCALGAVINDNTIDRFRCSVIAGAANNQLEEPRHAELLEKRGILYAPDFVINAGGVVNCSVEFESGGYDRNKAYSKASMIYDRLMQIFEIAQREKTTTHKAAELLAEDRIRKVTGLKRIWSAR